MKGKTYVWLAVIIVVVVALFMFSSGGASSFEAVETFEGDITIYKSSTCGCCGGYSGYFKRQGNSNVELVNTEELNSIKRQFGVPPALESCHTTVMGDYFIEGHVPLEAIEKLLQEKPDIEGIAMSGMPSGSPGMPGGKVGDFVIYAVDHDGGYEEWMRL